MGHLYRKEGEIKEISPTKGSKERQKKKYIRAEEDGAVTDYRQCIAGADNMARTEKIVFANRERFSSCLFKTQFRSILKPSLLWFTLTVDKTFMDG